MDIAYLQNILAELVLLDLSQDKELERLKTKTIQAFQHLFPNEPQLIRQVQNLSFNSPLGMYSKDFRDRELDSINKLKTVIEKKIDALKHQSGYMKQKELDDLTKYQEGIINQHQGTVDQYRIELKKADDKLAQAKVQQLEQSVKMETLEAKLKTASRKMNINSVAFWSLAFVVLGGAFTFGVYVGNVKYDTEKIELSEQNRALMDSIRTYYGVSDYLRSKANSAHNLLGHMPYDELKLDSIQWRKVQTHIESVGFVLDTMAHYKTKIR